MRCLAVVGVAHLLGLSGTFALLSGPRLVVPRVIVTLPAPFCPRGASKALSAIPASSSPSSAFGDNITSTEASLASIATLYRRVSWVSWWFQIILSVIGGVILTFANTVRKGGNTYALWSSGFALSAIGAFTALLNAVWTWNMTRMSRRIARKKIEESRVIPTLRRLSKISVTVSLLGMLITLFAAEQIVGTLASKVLSSQGLVPTLSIGSQLNQIQALDIFLVQANTNILVAHYVPLAAFLWLQTQLPGGSTKSTAPSPITSPVA